MAAAASFLAVRVRSVAETRARMLRLGYPTALVDQTLQRLLELGYLDDGAFARTWVESRDRAHPRGQASLRRELALKGIARDVVDAVMEERSAGSAEPDPATGPGPADGGLDLGARREGDGEVAASLLARRSASLRREPDPRRRRQKAYSLLARHGFDPDVCRVAAAAFIDGETVDAEGEA